MLLPVATKTTAKEEIPVLVLKSVFVKQVKRGTKTTPPPMPNIPESNPPIEPIRKYIINYFRNLGKSSLPSSLIVSSWLIEEICIVTISESNSLTNGL